MTHLRTYATAALLAGSLAACGGKENPGPEIASAASQPQYAMDYSARLDQEIEAFGQNESFVIDESGKFADYPDELKEGPYDVAADAIEAADASGHSAYYVEGARSLGPARDFFDDEREPIAKKVGGAANYTVKQANCDVEIYGAVATSLDKAVDERLEERLREYNDGQLILDRHEDRFEKADLDKLRDQVDSVALLSYTVRIEMVEQKVRITEMLEDASKVKSTMDDFIADEEAFQKESTTSDKGVAASNERIDAMKASQAELANVEKEAEAMLKKIDERLDKAEEAYEKALDQVVERYRTKAQ